jgi:hypothetical protein
MAALPRRVRNRRDLERLSEKQQRDRSDALLTVALMREDPRMSLTKASRRIGTRPETVRRYAGEALDRRGTRWTVTKGDRLYRAMFVNSGGEKVPVDVRGSRKASELSAYHRAVANYLATGEEEPLRAFAGKSVAGVEYETDLDVLDEMARRRQLNIESIYQFVS